MRTTELKNLIEIFKEQIDKGATEMFFYGLERPEPWTISIMRHKGTLDSFPTNLEFVRMMTPSNPLFREGHREWNEDLFA